MNFDAPRRITGYQAASSHTEEGASGTGNTVLLDLRTLSSIPRALYECCVFGRATSFAVHKRNQTFGR